MKSSPGSVANHPTPARLFTAEPAGGAGCGGKPPLTRVDRTGPRELPGGRGRAHSTVRQAAGIEFEGGTYEMTWFLADLDVDGPLEPGWVHAFPAASSITVFVPLGRPARASGYPTSSSPRGRAGCTSSWMVRTTICWCVSRRPTPPGWPGCNAATTGWSRSGGYPPGPGVGASYWSGPTGTSRSAAPPTDLSSVPTSSAGCNRQYRSLPKRRVQHTERPAGLETSDRVMAESGSPWSPPRVRSRCCGRVGRVSDGGNVVSRLSRWAETNRWPC